MLNSSSKLIRVEKRSSCSPPLLSGVCVCAQCFSPLSVLLVVSSYSLSFNIRSFFSFSMPAFSLSIKVLLRFSTSSRSLPNVHTHTQTRSQWHWQRHTPGCRWRWIFSCTSPSASAASPLWPEPSSAGPQWNLGAGGWWTSRGCRRLAAWCAWWCLVLKSRIWKATGSEQERENMWVEFHLQCSFDGGGVKGGGGCLTLALLSSGLIVNFLSVKEMFLISLQGKPIFGVILVEMRCTKVSHDCGFYIYFDK